LHNGTTTKNYLRYARHALTRAQQNMAFVIHVNCFHHCSLYTAPSHCKMSVQVCIESLSRLFKQPVARHASIKACHCIASSRLGTFFFFWTIAVCTAISLQYVRLDVNEVCFFREYSCGYAISCPSFLIGSEEQTMALLIKAAASLSLFRKGHLSPKQMGLVY